MRFDRMFLRFAGLAVLLVTAPVAAQLGSRPAEEWIKTLDGPARVAATSSHSLWAGRLKPCYPDS